jgi:hypothetical protein
MNRWAFATLPFFFFAALPACASTSGEDVSADEGESALTTPVTEATGPSAASTRLDAQYAQPALWQTIADHAYREIGYDAPPCATFASTALEKLAGIPLPADHQATIKMTQVPSLPVHGQQPHTFDRVNGTYQIRYNTSGLSTYLMQRGFHIVWEPANLLPGDLVFVLPADYGARAHVTPHPAHTYMFHAWVDAAKEQAWVIDNEADGYCAPDEAPADRTFIAYCDAHAHGPLLCCAGQGLHMYKRSVSVSAPEPAGAKTPGEIDQRMWFALRAP